MMSTNQSDLTAFDVDAAPEGACVRYEVCGRTVPGRGEICGPCLDALRSADRERQRGESA
jgi:hypothetical protein